MHLLILPPPLPNDETTLEFFLREDNVAIETSIPNHDTEPCPPPIHEDNENTNPFIVYRGKGLNNGNL